LLQAVLKQQYASRVNPESGGKYLQEIVQLFTALSSGFDLIMKGDGAQLDVRFVRRAIFHRRWSFNKTQDSFQYLESLFHAQENPTTNPLRVLTDEAPIANLRLSEISPSFVWHSRAVRESDSTEHEEELEFNHGNINGAPFNNSEGKRIEENTLIIQTPYEDPYLTTSSAFRRNYIPLFTPQNEPLDR
jgi:hypothetical protein